jgi:putative endonuclease
MWRWLNKLGERGEATAARFLRRRGLRILARNYHCPIGEIDLVADHDGAIVFVEVKTRASAEHGQPWEAVDREKRRKITRVAVHFLLQYRLTNRTVRFDVVAITGSVGWLRRPTIEHFPDAFQADGPWSV